MQDGQVDLFLLEDSVWVLTRPTANPSYDFLLTSLFSCRRPWNRPELVHAIGRIGAFADYRQTELELAEIGVRLVNTFEQHKRGSLLPEWYPLVADVTPRSVWFDSPPTAEEIGDLLGWPVFVKGERQTSKHSAELAIARSPGEFAALMSAYRADPILSWQRVVCRKFVPLRAVNADGTHKIRPSFEFRTFWWHGRLVGAGPYWSGFAGYDWTKREQQEAITLAERAARLVDVPFLVIDLAQSEQGEWLVIECNDAQESGYAGVSPFALWQNIVANERSRQAVDC
jgi:hypothetical protein